YKIDANKGNIESQIRDVYEDTQKKGGNYLIEEFLTVRSSPSVIAVFDDAGVFPLAQTSQVLHGTKYAGNVIDLNGNTKYIDFVFPLLKDMHAKGYRGQGGIDLIETNDGSLYICEVNARGTGAFFPASVLSRINESVANYQMNMVRSDTIKINAFEDHNHFYELLSEFGLEPIHNKGVGIIDINPGKIISVDNNGKVDAQIAILGKNNVEIMKTRQKFISLFS
ncbi:ATP-grasp domain-containing protein, partial [bacterium]|nr:ATP-grasp domain-containing protein [bacterium]